PCDPEYHRSAASRRPCRDKTTLRPNACSLAVALSPGWAALSPAAHAGTSRATLGSGGHTSLDCRPPGSTHCLDVVHHGPAIASSPGNDTTSLTVTWLLAGARDTLPAQYQPRYPGSRLPNK